MAEHKLEDLGAADVGGDMTLWDFADPAEAVDKAVAMYGAKASTAVASAAFTARYAGREADFRFWFTVFEELRRRSEKAGSLGHEDPNFLPEEAS